MLQAELKSLPPVNKNTLNPLPTYQLAIDNLPELIYWKNTNLVFLGCNLAFARAVGLTSPQEIIGKTDEQLPLSKQTLDFLGNRDGYVTQNNTAFEHSYVSASISGKQVWLHISKNPLINADGKVAGMLCRIEDITKRKLEEAAREQLQKQEQFLRTVYDGAENALIVIDVAEDGKFRYVGINSATETDCNLSKEQVIGKTPEELFGEVEGAKLCLHYRKCAETGKSLSFEQCFIFNNQKNYWLTTVNPLKDNCDRVYRLIVTSLDITQRRQAEIRLRNSLKESADFKFALDQSAIVAITDSEGNIEYVNDKFCEISQYSREELIGENHRIINSNYHPTSFFAQMWQTIKNGEVWRGEIQNRAKDGTLYWVDTTIVPMSDPEGKNQHYIAIRSDISARKKAEAQVNQKAQDLEKALYQLQCAQTQLVQSEKMSALGQLVAGVAHEINNPVNFIYGNINHADNFAHDLLQIVELYRQHYPQRPSEIQELEEELDFDFLVEDLPRILKSMKVGAQRIREIVTSLRNFSRMDEAQMKKVDIHEGIDSTLMILEHRIKAKCDRSRIEINKDYSNFPQIECYAGQLNQVFMNILANAIDALEEKIESSSDFNSPVICIKTELIESKQVKISISDNANGIPEDIKTRLFDPFFTTKHVGKGTGMGLSISYQIIVEKHSGSLNCISTPGEGTEFVITIPTQQAKST